MAHWKCSCLNWLGPRPCVIEWAVEYLKLFPVAHTVARVQLLVLDIVLQTSKDHNNGNTIYSPDEYFVWLWWAAGPTCNSIWLSASLWLDGESEVISCSGGLLCTVSPSVMTSCLSSRSNMSNDMRRSIRQESEELCLVAVYTKTFLPILGMAVSATARLCMPFPLFVLAVPVRELSIYIYIAYQIDTWRFMKLWGKCLEWRYCLHIS